MKKLLLFILLLFLSCEEPTIEGCTFSSACNYNIDATADDGSCSYSEENYDCDGNCTIGLDCAGACGGTAEKDDCGTCDNDTTNDCQEIVVSFNMGNNSIHGLQFDIIGGTLIDIPDISGIEINYHELSEGVVSCLIFSKQGLLINNLPLTITFAGSTNNICLSDVILAEAGGNEIALSEQYCAIYVPPLQSNKITILIHDYACDEWVFANYEGTPTTFDSPIEYSGSFSCTETCAYLGAEAVGARFVCNQHGGGEGEGCNLENDGLYGDLNCGWMVRNGVALTENGNTEECIAGGNIMDCVTNICSESVTWHAVECQCSGGTINLPYCDPDSD